MAKTKKAARHGGARIGIGAPAVGPTPKGDTGARWTDADNEAFFQEVKRGGGARAVASRLTKRLGRIVTVGAVHGRTMRMKLGGLIAETGVKTPAETEENLEDRQAKQLVAATKRKAVQFETLCDILDVSPSRLRHLIAVASDKGFAVKVTGDSVGRPPSAPGSHEKAFEIIVSKTTSRHVIAIVGDVHFGNKHHLSAQFNDFCERAYERGVRHFFQVGDLLDGVYRHSVWEQSHRGFEEQANYAAEALPRWKDATWHFIQGNHDETFAESSGIDVGRAIVERFKSHGRSDLVYHGARGGYMRLHAKGERRGLFVEMWHPRDRGNAYAKCYDSATEVLTDKGWLFFKDITGAESIATLNPSGHVEWHRPTERQVYNYTGPMFRVRSRLIDLLVTPDHDFFVADAPYKTSKRHWKRIKAKECAAKWTWHGYSGRWRMKRNALPQEGPRPDTYEIQEIQKRHNKPVKHLGRVPINEFLRLLGYYTSEGCVSKGRSGHPDGCVNLSQSKKINPEVHADMVRCIRACGCKPYAHDHGMQVASRELASEMLQCGRGSYNKRIPGWVKQLHPQLLRVFFDAYMAGDGSCTGRSKIGHAITVSRQLADDLQEVALRLGFSASIQYCENAGTYDSNYYCVSFNAAKNEPRLDMPIETETYSGNVYDVTVPNHVLYVRRNGKPCWSGNSYRIQKKIESYMPGAKPDILAVGHWHTSIFLTARGVHALSAGCWQGAGSSFAKSLGTAPDIGSWIVEYGLTNEGTVRELSPTWISHYEVETVRDVALG